MEHQEIKMKLLQSLIDQLEDWGADKHAPKKMAVEVSAPSEEKLGVGLDKAKEMLSPHDEPESESEDSDEDRLRALMEHAGDDESEEEDESDSKPSFFGRRK